jgi:hypothetical protein
MGKKRLNNWRRWLPMFSFGLLILAPLAPLSETPHEILMLTASMGLLVYLLTDSPASRREVARLLIALAALVPLALLVSIDPKWVIFGSLGVYIGIPLWKIVRDEHAEYLAERTASRDAGGSGRVRQQTVE